MRHVIVAMLVAGLGVQTAFAATGRTVGTHDVSNAGEGRYTIPITLPKGANDLTPQLAFSYAHRRGNGLMGVGWEISGLSAIRRCNKTTVTDNINSAPKNSIGDAYCLDGRRLRGVSGTYGTTDSIYFTQLESFLRTRALADTTASNSAFEVRTKEGLIYQYGNTTDSRIEPIGGG
jgi:hypothetical protein